MGNQSVFSNELKADLLHLAKRKKKFYTATVILNFLILFLPIYSVESALFGIPFPRGLLGVIITSIKECFFNSFEDKKIVFFLSLCQVAILIAIVVCSIRGIARAFYWRKRMNSYLLDSSDIRYLAEDLFCMHWNEIEQKKIIPKRTVTKGSNDNSAFIRVFLLFLVALADLFLYAFADHTK